jgi:sugar phosphate isomerase/epimerase
MTTRRQFLKTSSYLAAGSLLLPVACSNDRKKIGVQVYSVRDALQKDFAGSMKKLADIGYSYIEAYGLDLEGKLFGMAPAEYKKIVTDLGMELLSAHATYFTPEQAPKVIAAAQEAGVKYLIMPWLAEDLRHDYSNIAANLNQVGELFKGTGIKFGYHNHDFEFVKEGDKIPLEILITETQADLVTFEADLYWVTKAGANPMELINKFPGRFSLFHVKDADSKLDQTTVGSGIIDFETILNNKAKAGAEYYFVEDERTETPFENLKASFDYLNASNFG